MSVVMKPVRILNSCLGVLLFVVEACSYNRPAGMIPRVDLLFSSTFHCPVEILCRVEGRPLSEISLVTILQVL
jgi:hypothetical protein